jgi:ParB family chromosome partitioning protein
MGNSMMQAQKRRLGRGLAALIGEDSSEEGVVRDIRSLRHLPVELLQPNPHNPRKHFDTTELEDLARSIREKGLLQPLVVRPKADGHYEIVAGERRWRAAQQAGLHDLPAVIRELSDQETLEIALIENVQRSDLNPLEEARAYALLIEQFTYTQQQLADAIGKSRSHIANMLRLLTLPQGILEMIENGSITAGHARALIAHAEPEALAAQIVAQGLSVRETEELTRRTPENSQTSRTPDKKDVNTLALERDLGTQLGLKVVISDKGKRGGSLTVHYKSVEQLDDVCRKLTGGN